MLLVHNGPYLKRTKHWWGTSSYQRAGGASRRDGGEIPPPNTLYGKKCPAIFQGMIGV